VALLQNRLKRRQVRRFAGMLSRSNQATPQIWACDSVGDLPRVAEEAIAAGVDVLVPGGGDGTVLQTLNALPQFPPLLIAPLGSSNDYARALGHRSLEGAVASLVRGETSRHDLGHCTVRTLSGEDVKYRFCSSAGAGYAAAVLSAKDRRVPSWIQRIFGDWIYPPIALALVWTYPESKIALTVDGERVEVDCTLIELGKVPDTGGFKFTPTARPDSGDFELCLGVETSFFKRLHLLLRFLFPKRFRPRCEEYLGGHGQNRWGLGAARRVELEADPPMPVHLNGDPVGTTPVTFDIEPGALELVGRRAP
jgi:diacylglycerol kinase family enzyme